jgi:8-oxo-dGTP pyrophosphatase MutT (NUDIX family)
MSKIKDRVTHLIDDWTTHSSAFARTGFWGAYGGAGGIALARSTGRLLLAQRSRQVLQPGTWGTVGGAIDPGEQPKDAVLREIREELGFHATEADLHLCYVFRDGRTSFTYHNYIVLVDEEFLPTMNWEVSEHAWIEFGQWPSPLHFGMEAWLQDSTGISMLRAIMQQYREANDK